ncbi:response regulator [Actinoplanes sp. NPDC049265]|uniref:response regulator n=1 Tax=Actinoplanes sp. NPDC049265 TaxID=3363902 RepID=UPI0037132FFF
MITVLVVDDNASVRATLRPLLEADGGISVVGEADNGRAALITAARLRPRVTLLDYRMPIADGLTVIEELAQRTAVLVLTSSPEPELIEPMLQKGARGYLVYGQFDPADLPRAVHAVAAGQGWLTPTAASIAAAGLRNAYARQQDERSQAERQRSIRDSFGLTAREEHVLDLLCAGLTNAALATRLGVSEKTVKNHLNSVFAKLDVRTRTEAMIRWQS